MIISDTLVSIAGNFPRSAVLMFRRVVVGPMQSRLAASASRTGSQLIVSMLMIVAAGCVKNVPTEHAPESREATTPERPFASQLAAVRDGSSDRIQIEFQPVTDDELLALEGLETLEVLLLDHPQNHLSHKGLAALAKAPSLVHLRLRGVPIDEKSAEAIAEVSGLKILNIPQSELTDEGLAKLTSLSNLVQLRIGSSQLTDRGLEQLKQFPKLARVHLIDVPLTDQGLAVFQELPKLESLYIDGAQVSDAAYEKLFAAKPRLHVHVDQAHHDRDPNMHAH